jgi:L,D-peptidoglycan transpeptidase YkuD (ErfK/YbiS/YcfS/YnhG family)
LRCALGRSGVRAAKREGDGATPRGTFALERTHYRRDRILRPRTALALRSTRPADGWCDAASDRNYNRPVTHPYPVSAEHLWRRDGLYDLLVVVDYNRRPRRRGCGSAIFMHVAGTGLAPTEGCIALARRDLVKVLAATGPGTRLVVV